MSRNSPDPGDIGFGIARFVAAVFGLVFFGIGLTVLGSLWLSADDQPPLVFRLFGSFIAIAFVAMGGAMAFGAIFGKMMLSPVARVQAMAKSMGISPAPAGAVSYTCPHCNAPLQNRADVSPSGDAKCTFCNSWFNVRQK